VFRRSVIDQIPAGQVVSVERETFPGLIEAGAVVMGYAEAAYWLGVGTPEAVVRGSCDVVMGAPSSRPARSSRAAWSAAAPPSGPAPWSATASSATARPSPGRARSAASPS